MLHLDLTRVAARPCLNKREEYLEVHDKTFLIGASASVPTPSFSLEDPTCSNEVHVIDIVHTPNRWRTFGQVVSDTVPLRVLLVLVVDGDKIKIDVT